MPIRFADPVPELKRQLATEIVTLMDGWAVHQAGALVGVDGPCVSKLRRGHLERLSLQKLVRILARMSRMVEIAVHPTGDSTLFRKPGERIRASRQH